MKAFPLRRAVALSALLAGIAAAQTRKYEPTPTTPTNGAPSLVPEVDMRGGLRAVSFGPGTKNCDFDQQICTIEEGQELKFQIFFQFFAPFPICVFADPLLLPDGATFPPKQSQVGEKEAKSTFNWTPGPCQGGQTYRVHFHGNFDCGNLDQSGIFGLDIQVMDTQSCPESGACCVPTGQCFDLSKQQCNQSGGTFRGDGVMCNQVTCPNTQGPCCLRGGTCFAADEATCHKFLGQCETTAADCPNANCLGACCTSNGQCLDGLTVDECRAEPNFGTHRGPGSTCESNPCPGACCLPDGMCFDTPDRASCFFTGGVFRGHGTNCATAECPFFGGACCLSFGGCIVVSHQTCDAQGGTFSGTGVDCPPTGKCPPPPATGACCSFDFEEGFCMDGVTEEECRQAGEQTEYLGDGTTCDNDEDNDTVPDCVDFCRGTPKGEPVVTDPLAIFVGLLGCSCTQRIELCADGNPCTADICDIGGAGTDELGCRNNEPAPEINDGIDCTIDDCDEQSGITHTPDHARCEDGDLCTNNVCTTSAGCVSSNVVCEEDEIECTRTFCDPARGCVHDPLDFRCEQDGIDCTEARCDPVRDCIQAPIDARCEEDGNPCTFQFCDPGHGCSDPVAVSCEDQFACTLDVCISATPLGQNPCLHVPLNERCEDNDPCTEGVCDPGNLAAEPDGCVITTRRPRGPDVLVCGDGDMNGDGLVDSNDTGSLVDCLSTGGPGIGANGLCGPGDFDGDGDVDIMDVQFYFADPFRCDPSACQTLIGRKCASACAPGQSCVLDSGGEGALAGGEGEARCSCETDFDCLVGRCEECRGPEGAKFCTPRCDPMRCEGPCDGQGNCPSVCRENEVCDNGRCIVRCASDAECDQDRCQKCDPGERICVDKCNPETEACGDVIGFPGVCLRRDECDLSSPTSCQACETCVDYEFFTVCVPCEALGQVCRDDKCFRPCGEDHPDAPPCQDCEACINGVCVDQCTPPERCVRNRCREICRGRADCGRCEFCGFLDQRCISCDDIPGLFCNAAGDCEEEDE